MRRITKATVKFLSLVPKGANRLATMFKGDDGKFAIECIVKDDQFAEKGELTAIVYSPESRDSQGDIASAAVIKDMAYNYAQEGTGLDVRHDCNALQKNQAFVAESFIVQKSDPRFIGLQDYDGHDVDPTGAWAVVIKILDEGLKTKYRNGDFRGISLFGDGVVQVGKSDDIDPAKITAAVVATIKQLQGFTANTETDDMTPEQLKELGETIVTGVSKAVAEQNKPVKKTDDEEERKKAPIFKGDPTSATDIAAHQEALVKWQLVKDVDFANPTSVAAYMEQLEKLAKAKAAAADENKSPQVLALEKEVAEKEALLKKARQGSNQPDGGNDDIGADFEGTGLSKEDIAAVESGRRMAKFINDQNPTLKLSQSA